MQKAEQTIPDQQTGRATDFTADREYDNRQAAHKAFKQAALVY